MLRVRFLWIWAFLFESIKKEVNIDTKLKKWKSITEIDFTFRQYVWLYCAAFSLGCGGGDEGIITPCIIYKLENTSWYNVTYTMPSCNRPPELKTWMMTQVDTM